MPVFDGGPTNDTLTGSVGDDTLNGFDGNDLLIGGLGADQLNGGAGSRDAASYFQSFAAVTVDLSTGLGTGGEAQGDVLSGIENLIGSAHSDTLIGDDQNNRLRGNSGDDTIDGGGGNDTIVGGAGADSLSGGDGIDWLSYLRSDQGVTINLKTNSASNGFAAGDVISGFENVRGSQHDDHLTGDDQDNVLRGENGNDTLLGGDGNDRLIGGRGGDYMDGGDGFDVVSYLQETDGVAIDVRTPNNIGNARGDTLISIEGIHATQFGDSLIMGDEDNRIYGHGGNDFMDGGNGNDTLVGGEGADFLHGGAGRDTASYRSSDAAINVSMTFGPNTGGHAEGDVFSSMNNIVGSRFSDSIEGDRLGNRLTGLDGDDTLIGRAGKDTLIGNEGADTFVFFEKEESVGRTQNENHSVDRYNESTFDVIKDFESGIDVLQFTASEFSGTVVNSDDVDDLNFDSADDSGFLYDGRDLYYVEYASEEDFDAGRVTIRHVAQLNDVTELSIDDFVFV